MPDVRVGRAHRETGSAEEATGQRSTGRDAGRSAGARSSHRRGGTGPALARSGRCELDVKLRIPDDLVLRGKGFGRGADAPRSAT